MAAAAQPARPDLQIINSLTERNRQLELRLVQQQEQSSALEQQFDAALLGERRENQNLVRELTAARSEVVQTNDQLVQSRRRSQESDRALAAAQQQLALQQGQTAALRQEVAALAQQAVNERQQVQALSVQLTSAMQRSNLLENQVRQLTRLMEKQQQMLLQQREKDEIAELEKIVALKQAQAGTLPIIHLMNTIFARLNPFI